MGWFDKYCEICGNKVDKKIAPQRFGKHFCSEAHAKEYVDKVNAAQAKAPPRQESRGGCC